MDKITGALQENLLTLLCYDKAAAAIIKNVVELGLYSSDIYRDIAYEAITFYDTFGTPIGDHLPDAFEEVLEGRDRRKANLYTQVIRSLHDTKDSVNTEYVMSRLSAFVREQGLSKAVTEAAKYIRSGDIESAEGELLKGLRNRELEAFNPGMFLSESPPKVMAHLRSESNHIPIGIPALNQINFGPAPKELMLILAPTSRGKTWFMVHIGKYGLLQQKNVLHITLEMSEEKVMTRYYQSLLSISKRTSKNKVAQFNIIDGELKGIDFRIQTSPTFKSKNLSKFITKKIPSILNRYRLLVKQFPTGMLTLPMLESYLDLIEREHNFIPDMILLDYADLMEIDSRNLRIETGGLIKRLRGLMVERNIAGVTGSQGNRASEDAVWVTLQHLAEDYSKAATSDCVITICQTSKEKLSNLARLFVVKNRDEEDNITVLIAQGLQFGQFVLESFRIKRARYDQYEKEVGELAKESSK